MPEAQEQDCAMEETRCYFRPVSPLPDGFAIELAETGADGFPDARVKRISIPANTKHLITQRYTEGGKPRSAALYIVNCTSNARETVEPEFYGSLLHNLRTSDLFEVYGSLWQRGKEYREIVKGGNGLKAI